MDAKSVNQEAGVQATLRVARAADLRGEAPHLSLLDRRRRRPSHRTASRAEVQRVLHLYRARYTGFSVRHFHHLARRDHG